MSANDHMYATHGVSHGVGITIERGHSLHDVDPYWSQWIQVIAGPWWVVGLRPLNESLTTWRVTRLYWPRTGRWPWDNSPAADPIEYDVIVHTPPGRPEWLEAIEHVAPITNPWKGAAA